MPRLQAFTTGSDLPTHVETRLHELCERLRLPPVKLKLWNEVLTSAEVKLAGDAGITKRAEPKDWVTFSKILEVVATTRNLSRERALLELAQSASVLEFGEYLRLREGIGEPMNAKDLSRALGHGQPKPHWDKERGELQYLGKVIRKARVCKTSTSLQMILDKLEEAGWPPSIGAPMKSDAIHRKVHELNKGLKGIRFVTTRGSTAISWSETKVNRK